MAPFPFNHRTTRLLVWIAGMILFAAAFFLPAVRQLPATGPAAWGAGLQSRDFSGWECALITSWLTVQAVEYRIHPRNEAPDSSSPLAIAPPIMSGWVNPLVLAYLVSSGTGKLHRLRTFLAGVIVLCLIATWTFLWKEHFTLLIGHYLWVGGIIMMFDAPLACALM